MTDTRRLLAAIFVGAIVVRVLMLGLLPNTREWHDSAHYHRQAQQLLAGEGYLSTNGRPTSWRPLGYPLFVAAVYAVAGPRPSAVLATQILLDALACVLVFVLARRLFGVRSAVIASVLAVISLTQIYASGLLLAESLAMFLVLVIALALHTALTRPSWLALGAVGVLLGVGVLVKGTFLACLGVTPLLIAWAWWGRWRRAAIGTLLVVGLAALVLAPWTIRNYQLHGRFVPVSTQVGFNIYCGLNPKNGYIFGWCYGPEISAVKDALPEAEASAEFLRRGVAKVTQNPGMLPGNVALKVLYFFSPVDWEFMPGSEKGGGVLNATYVFMAPFAVWGLVRARRRGWTALLPAAFVLAMLGAVILTESAPRYRFPAEPLIAVYAGLGLSALGELSAAARRVAVAAVAAHATLAVAVFLLGDQLRVLARSVLRTAGLG